MRAFSEKKVSQFETKSLNGLHRLTLRILVLQRLTNQGQNNFNLFYFTTNTLKINLLMKQNFGKKVHLWVPSKLHYRRTMFGE